ncbi:baseplate J/gp47 family protein [Ewingella americana]|uniref:Baseplate J/gp47 family protein n=1 Tax=Ewingella americana TaxID=41202 RepID=A0A502GNH7_9GAMM|nr:baseplate J/gp47 family protein [Ewingella americana]TPG62546.1 baseplate J/gp47 family protein [Ewingella americana]
MPYNRPTLSELRARNIAAIESELKGVGTPLRFSNLNILGSADAGLAYLHYGYLDWIAKQSVPWSATDENLAGWAALKSVTQKAANAGTNNGTIFTGISGKTVPAGTVLNRGDGYQYTVSTDVAITSAGSGTGSITAVLPDPNDDPTGGGAAGNTPAGTQLTLDTSISGIDSTVIIGTSITNGADIESEDAFRTRMLLAYQNTPQGGNDEDYESWALAVSGVTRAWTVRRLMGAGSVGVYIMIDGNDTSNHGFPVGADGISRLDNWSAAKATGDQGRVADAIYPQQPVTSLVCVCSPIQRVINFTINGISSVGSSVTAAIAAAIDGVLFESGNPQGATILLSDLLIAISNVSGTSGFILTSPSVNITTATGELPVRGTVTYT